MNKEDYIVDERGKWAVNDDGTRDLLEPSESLLLRWEEESNKFPIPEPTQEEINVEFDYRLSLVELGLQ